jgi:hypothetical protein
VKTNLEAEKGVKSIEVEEREGEGRKRRRERQERRRREGRKRRRWDGTGGEDGQEGGPLKLHFRINKSFT